MLGYVDLRVPDGLKVEDYVTSLEESGLFEVVQYNTLAELFISPNDAFISNQYYLNTINVYNAWDITVGKQSVIAAVIDSEADRQHADLGYGSNWYTNYSTLLGWNYTENTNSPASPQFHGTSVSGIISAKTNNSLGIAGVSGGNYCPGVLLAKL